jgi:hypothetical protein
MNIKTAQEVKEAKQDYRMWHLLYLFSFITFISFVIPKTTADVNQTVLYYDLNSKTIKAMANTKEDRRDKFKGIANTAIPRIRRGR